LVKKVVIKLYFRVWIYFNKLKYPLKIKQECQFALKNEKKINPISLAEERKQNCSPSVA